MAKTLSRSAMLARDLLGRIARRELRPGDPIDLPALGRRHGVSRTVVREALADLGGKGLIVARPKVGTTISPESQWNLLDPDLVDAAIRQDGPESMLQEGIELRRVVEPALAAAAARDASRAQRRAVLEALRGLADAIGAAATERMLHADEHLHATIAAACGNRMLRSIDMALAPVRSLQRRGMIALSAAGAAPSEEAHRLLALRTGLALAIARGDAHAATAHALAAASVAVPHAPAQEPEQPPAAPAGSVPPRTANGAPSSDPARPDAARPDPAPVADTDEWPDTMTMGAALPALSAVRRGMLDPMAAASPLEVPVLLDAPAPRLADSPTPLATGS
jgi:DNA-binding FadR family transcriptional regulator